MHFLLKLTTAENPETSIRVWELEGTLDNCGGLTLQGMPNEAQASHAVIEEALAVLTECLSLKLFREGAL